ncbi:SNF2 family N-terminal domain-containing protein [Cantharellus anzutake]|uniref:SNF2 family N-terminal domain-containing protein n=1 Tax=Cantharellus anzutake TaxID=1750568 RepID=UPI0019061304|nr:SNF2 family N-terminal domain-containing protein [Cantharellus anzutake]KAF8342156.1 SNF2 family N-terminal domain-containing protein [Cantharellus anzutake]
MAKTGDSTKHTIVYAPTNKSTCHGPHPCKGSKISIGSLRYGLKYHSPQYGESWSWRHWGCVTTDILEELGNVSLYKLPGWSKLTVDDKTRVMTAVRALRVDPSDVPASARPLDWSDFDNRTSQPQSSSQVGVGQKRKFEASIHGSSQTQPTSSQTAVQSSQIMDLDDSDDDLGWVVGLQYYNGLVGDGEQVSLVREPTNEFDRNAIQVMNLTNQQVGHIKREFAQKLSPLIDANLILVEGTIVNGNMHGFVYDLDITLHIYGASDTRSALEPMLKWATPGQRGFTDALRAKYKHNFDWLLAAYLASSSLGGYSSISSRISGSQKTQSQSAKLEAERRVKLEMERRAKLEVERIAAQKGEELKTIIKGFEKVDDESRRASLLDSLCSKEDIMNLPVYENPPGKANGLLKSDLMKHQLQALKWCIDRENPVLPTSASQPSEQFWRYDESTGKPLYLNVESNQPVPVSRPPVLGRGAILADAMGLGKTLSMISLIVATKEDVPKDYCNATLVVAPVSILRTWEVEIADHCADNLSVYTYYEKNRDIAASELQKYDVVITSYHTCTGDWSRLPDAQDAHAKKKSRGSSALYDVKWKRIILDEGHNIRNPNTKQHKALKRLDAQRRWVVTGTPIINSPKDLGALLHFLQICRPLSELDYFNRRLIRPLNQGDGRAANLLKTIMSHVCLRRTKEMQNSKGEYLIELPPVEMTTVKVTLDPETRKLYDELESTSRDRFSRHMRGQHDPNRIQVPFNALAMLTRLRQLALHPALVPRSYLEELTLQNMEDENTNGHSSVSLSHEDRRRLQNLLFQFAEDNEECAICFDVLRDPRITPCAHAFCLECITNALSRDPKCPMDRRRLFTGDLIEPPPSIDTTQPQVRLDLDDDREDDARSSSAKINELIHLLQLTPSDEKSVVFSQFTSFLDKIAEQLSEHGIPFVRFDGSMSAARRTEALEYFNIPLKGDSCASAGSPNLARRKDPHKLYDLEEVNVELDEMDAGSALQNTSQAPAMNTANARESTRKRLRPNFLGSPLSSESESDDFLRKVEGSSSLKTKAKTRTLSDDYKPEAESAGPSDNDEYRENGGLSGGDGGVNVAGARRRTKGKGKAVAVPAPQGKKKEREAILQSYNISRDKIPVVMLISLKAGALGLQLTVANNVFLMDPYVAWSYESLSMNHPYFNSWWQEGIESQAIDRCNRIGQKRNVKVYQTHRRTVIAEDTVESKVLEIQERKRMLIKHASGSQAFSATKSTEKTRSTKKEARLQDLIELFGLRREAPAGA